MKNRTFRKTKWNKKVGYSCAAKKQNVEQYFWFANAGLLPSSNYDKAVLFVATYKLNSIQFRFILFLGIEYLIYYIELYTFDNTPLLTECIEKQIRYLKSLLGKQRRSKKYFQYDFMNKLQFAFDSLQFLEDSNYVCRQIYIDQLERICHLFSIRLRIWIKNSHLQSWLIKYGYDPFRSSAI